MGPGVGRKHNRNDRVAKKFEKEFGKRSWNRFGLPNAILFEAWWCWVITLGTPGLTFGTPGVSLGTPGLTLGILAVNLGTRGARFGHPVGLFGHPGVVFEAGFVSQSGC